MSLPLNGGAAGNLSQAANAAANLVLGGGITIYRQLLQLIAHLP